MSAQEGGHFSLIVGNVGEERSEAFFALRLLKKGHHKGTRGHPERRSHGGVHFLEDGIGDGENFVRFEEATGFKKCFVEAAVTLIQPPRGGFAQAINQPWRHGVGSLGLGRGVAAEGPLVNECGGGGEFETLVLDASAEVNIEPYVIADFAEKDLQGRGAQRHGVARFPMKSDTNRDFPRIALFGKAQQLVLGLFGELGDNRPFSRRATRDAKLLGAADHSIQILVDERPGRLDDLNRLRNLLRRGNRGEQESQKQRASDHLKSKSLRHPLLTERLPGI